MTRRMQDKLVKALNAKTPQGGVNYLIDAVADNPSTTRSWTRSSTESTR